MEPAPMGSPQHLLNLNPLTKLWGILDSNVALAGHFGKYVALAKIVMIQVHGSFPDERVFSSLNFLKDKSSYKLIGLTIISHWWLACMPIRYIS